MGVCIELFVSFFYFCVALFTASAYHADRCEVNVNTPVLGVYFCHEKSPPSGELFSWRAVALQVWNYFVDSGTSAGASRAGSTGSE